MRKKFNGKIKNRKNPVFGTFASGPSPKSTCTRAKRIAHYIQRARAGHFCVFRFLKHSSHVFLKRGFVITDKKRVTIFWYIYGNWMGGFGGTDAFFYDLWSPIANIYRRH